MSIKKLVFSLAAVAVVFGMTFAPASAQMSETELLQLIDSLTSQIATLQGQLGTGTPTTGGAACTFTRDLTEGVQGADVTCLQDYLKATGHFPVTTDSTGYFGPITMDAVAAWQSNNGVSPAVGYFGPISQSKYYSLVAGGPVIPPIVPPITGLPAGCTSTAGYSVTTGMPCSGGLNLPAGCTSTVGYSPTTGVKCDSTDDGTPTPDGDLTGGVGVVEEYKLVSSITNETVGEAEEDVEIIGLDVEASSDSDLELTAVRVVFVQSTNTTSDFEDYVEDVSVWLDGEEFARVDGDEFTDDNNWTKTLSLDSGAIIRSGDVGRLTVAVTGIGNLDSSDDDPDYWTVDVNSVRYVDGSGASTSEDPSTATRTFSFQSFAAATGAELVIAEDDADINDFHIIDIDTTNNTQDVEIASFTLKANGNSDLELRKLGINLDVAGTAAHVDDVIAGGASPAINLVIEGQSYGSATYGGDSTSGYTADTDGDVGTSENVRFADIDYTIPAGATVNVVITADILPISATLAAGDTIQVTMGETESNNTALFDIRDESNTKLLDADMRGSLTTDANALRAVGIAVEFVSASTAVAAGTSTDDDQGTFTVRYKITAFGDTVYVSSLVDASTAAVTAGKTTAVVDRAGTGTTGGVTVTLVNRTKGTSELNAAGLYVISDGETEEFELTGTATLPTVGSAGQYRMRLAGFYWENDDDDDTPDNVYSSNLSEFTTSYVGLN